MGTLRQGDIDSRLQRLRMCKHSSTLKNKMYKALKHRDKGHTETKTWKQGNTNRDSGTPRDGDIQTLKHID